MPAVGLPVQESLHELLVHDVRARSAAALDGLLPGDIILGVNGETAPALSFTEFVEYIKRNACKKVAMKVVREGAKGVELSVIPDESADGTGRIGVQ